MLRFSLKIFAVIFGVLLLTTAILPYDAIAADSCAASDTLPTPDKSTEKIDTHGVLPPNIMKNIAAVNKAVDAKVSRFLALGRAIECAATDFLANEWSLLIITIRFPNISLFMSGVAVWILGALLVMIIGYYLCDLSFKLGFAVMSLPIAIALWPFEKTKQYIGKIIHLMMHCTGVFIFLCLGVTYAIAIFDAAVAVNVNKDSLEQNASNDAISEIFKHFDASGGAMILEAFDLLSFNFLLLMFAGVYGFVLVGKSVNDYTKKFFPDDTGLQGQNPMMKGATQVTDFAKKQVGKAGALAKDVVKTQAGRGMAKVGGKLSGAVGKIGAGMAKAGGKMGAAGVIASALGKGLKGIGETGKKMADNHEAKYQNQGQKGELKNGNWQPKAGGGSAGGESGGNAGGGSAGGSGNTSQGGGENG